jgi:hypothetical protein
MACQVFRARIDVGPMWSSKASRGRKKLLGSLGSKTRYYSSFCGWFVANDGVAVAWASSIFNMLYDSLRFPDNCTSST